MKHLICIILIIGFSCNYNQTDDTSDKSEDSSINLNTQLDATTNVTFGLIDSISPSEFWKYAITPIVDLDKNKIVQTVNYPVLGDWSFATGLKKEPENVSINEFENSLEKVFSEELRTLLSSKSIQDIDTLIVSATQTFLTVSVEKEKNGFEGGILLKYTGIESNYKLHTIQYVGGNVWD